MKFLTRKELEANLPKSFLHIQKFLTEALLQNKITHYMEEEHLKYEYFA